ncbi:MAG: hypothetical protein AAGM22_19685 [Acidobacteriota bacterium]
MVQRQLVRRGLWLGPPRFVGLVGDDRWTAEALDELTSDALIHLLGRIRLLHRHLQIKGNVDGLVRLEVGHFLHDRQRRADPLGHRLYSVVHEAVHLAVELNRLSVIDGDPRITNKTLLAVGGAADVESTAAVKTAAAEAKFEESKPRLERAARRLVDGLMPELVTGWGPRRARVVKDLAASFDLLEMEGVVECRFKDLLDAIKRAVRWRWAGVLARETTPGERDEVWSAFEPSIGSATPDQSFEARQSFEALIACVTDRVERTEDLGRRSREHFANLWHFLRLRALESDDEATVAMPSRRQIAEILSIPRSTLNGLFERLRRVVEACRGGCPPSTSEKGGLDG